MPTLSNIYGAVNVLMPDDSIKLARLADKHYWLIPIGSDDVPMPFEILSFYNVWSAAGPVTLDEGIASGVIRLEDAIPFIDMPLGEIVGQTGDVVQFGHNGQIAGLFSSSQRPI